MVRIKRCINHEPKTPKLQHDLAIKQLGVQNNGIITTGNEQNKNKVVQKHVVELVPKCPGVDSCPIRRMSWRLARRSISPSAFERARFACRKSATEKLAI